MLVTNFGDFVRKYGNYLSETTHGEYRYLANSVEQFFMNGGTRCYISRVVPENAAAAQAQAGILHISAADEGSYGNQIVLRVNPTAKKKFQLLEKISDLEYNICTPLQPGCGGHGAGSGESTLHGRDADFCPV